MSLELLGIRCLELLAVGFIQSIVLKKIFFFASISFYSSAV